MNIVVYFQRGEWVRREYIPRPDRLTCSIEAAIRARMIFFGKQSFLFFPTLCSSQRITKSPLGFCKMRSPEVISKLYVARGCALCW